VAKLEKGRALLGCSSCASNGRRLALVRAADDRMMRINGLRTLFAVLLILAEATTSASRQRSSRGPFPLALHRARRRNGSGKSTLLEALLWWYTAAARTRGGPVTIMGSMIDQPAQRGVLPAPLHLALSRRWPHLSVPAI